MKYSSESIRNINNDDFFYYVTEIGDIFWTFNWFLFVALVFLGLRSETASLYWSE